MNQPVAVPTNQPDRNSFRRAEGKISGKNEYYFLYILSSNFSSYSPFLKYYISTYCKSFHRGVSLRICNFRIIIPLLRIDQKKIVPGGKQTDTSYPYVFHPLLRQSIIQHCIFQSGIRHIIIPVSIGITQVGPILIRPVKRPGIGCIGCFRCPIISSHPTVNILSYSRSEERRVGKESSSRGAA